MSILIVYINNIIVSLPAAAGTALRIQERHPEAIRLSIDCDIHHRPVQPGSVNEYVLHICTAPDVQPCLPVQSPVGKVVDHVAEGRYGGILCGVQAHGDQVFLPQAGTVGDLHPKGCIAAAMGIQFPAVAVHRGDMSGAVKLEKEPFPLQVGAEKELSAIGADLRIVGRRGIVKRHLPAGMGQAHALSFAQAAEKIFRALRYKLPSVVQTDHSRLLFRRLFFILHGNHVFFNRHALDTGDIFSYYHIKGN